MNLTAIVKSLSLIPSLLPLISSFVKQIEADLPAAAGSTKLAAVIAAVNEYLAKIEADLNVITALKTELAPVISGIVALYNASGLFTKAPPVAVVASVDASAPTTV